MPTFIVDLSALIRAFISENADRTNASYIQKTTLRDITISVRIYHDPHPGTTNTAIAEVSTGTGTQELLLYKVSSISDQVRVQTTGNVIFESGVSARGWPTASRIATPNFYIAASNSNVGINTSNPVTTLDVAGTGRFQTLSSLNITAGSINYSVAFV